MEDRTHEIARKTKATRLKVVFLVLAAVLLGLGVSFDAWADPWLRERFGWQPRPQSDSGILGVFFAICSWSALPFLWKRATGEPVALKPEDVAGTECPSCGSLQTDLSLQLSESGDEIYATRCFACDFLWGAQAQEIDAHPLSPASMSAESQLGSSTPVEPRRRRRRYRS